MKNLNQLSRRDFLKLSGAASLSLGLSACSIATEPTHTSIPTTTPLPSPSPTPGCTDLMSLAPMPQTRGERYIARIPDTLDLQEWAELAINALTRCTNPESNYDVYFYGELKRNPPVMYRLMPFYGKFWEGLALMRHITGSIINTQVDQHWRESFLVWFQQDNPVLDGPDGGRLLCWIANNYRFEKNSCWQKTAERAIENLTSTLAHNKDYCYMTDDTGAMQTGWDATFRGWTLQGVSSVLYETGSLVGERLGEQLARYLKDHAQIFDGNGSFLARHPSDMGPALHFHHNGNCMVAISEYALASGDLEFAAFAKKGYEFGLSVGWPLIGFFPEYINDWPDDRPYIDSETCCIVDMIMLAINLSKLGVGDYWDDVDRYVRNQFAEMQMKTGDWITQIAAKYPIELVKEGEDGEQIAERVVGSFSGWTTANDYIHDEGSPFISGCCTGNGARALFHIWENMLEFDAGKSKIHLLLNRASPCVDIDSFIPYEGQVDIKIKALTRLEVRIPEWVNPQEVRCTVNGISVEVAFQGRYAIVDQLESGNLVTLTFPISERTVDISIGNTDYTLVIKGNDVVSVNPPGKLNPLYQREKYRENHVRWVNRERFIPAI